MRWFITLCSAPGGLTSDCVVLATQLLIAAGAQVGDIFWLAPKEAAEIQFNAERPIELLDYLRINLAEISVDVNCGLLAGRRKQLLIADMDSTIVIGESLDELAKYSDFAEEIAAITSSAMCGELSFEHALKKRVSMLKGVSTIKIAKVLENIRLTPGAKELVATMKMIGAYCVLVSGSFKPITSVIRQRVGFDDDYSNILHTANSVIVGTVDEPILGRNAKLKIMKKLCIEHGLTMDATLAVGDGSNDLAMLKVAGIGVAFRAKPFVRSESRFIINHADLRGLLYLQGFKRSDFVNFPFDEAVR
ncbi:phosphoserine phosphatase SerB [Candidatus Endolissoclinum faulkneri L5]|uniref:Phosphoserine phosphatase n=1 Tax=Candidatus Endolissoclinum faulkneri L5 TaxID=1401328 RepID=V9TW28_9PROT|nr:phosphoserine phosphatase SerB [Candidatus Endolissoclinum faulkneri]AHC73908.1 phosphoserine phosphatase SerB [Candidatus Endolissoclinum faulkneri L5]